MVELPAIVGRSHLRPYRDQEEVNEVNTTEIENERRGSFGGGESDELRNDEWNGGSTEGLVSSVTKKPSMTTNPRTFYDSSWCASSPQEVEKVHATARLPDEVEIPLIKTQRMADTREEGPHVPDGPTEVLTIPGHEPRDYQPMRQPPTNETHDLWVRRTKELIPKVVEFRRGRPRRVWVTNISDRLVTCPVHLPLLLWVPRGDLPWTEGYVRLGPDKYNEWRVLAYSRSRDSFVGSSAICSHPQTHRRSLRLPVGRLTVAARLGATQFQLAGCLV
ncbi:unnamed protein product [Phytophthora fragariaefolia]|uniref:Unnamed protein product n=1 Tax=Phytophthora fragariaefolia TaxID=1490495 RepID=A0A9W6X3R0_9STRA|nr:unnamed protein product [Phytophthora fragariaefolia]